MVLTLEGMSSGGYPACPIHTSLQTVAGGPPQTGQRFSEFGGYPQTPSFPQRPMFEPRECYGCGEIGHIKRYCPKQSYRPPIVRGRGGHGRGHHSGGRGGHQTNQGGGQAGATAAQHGRGNGQTGDTAHCYAFLRGLKRRHLMLLSQVIFWFVIAWLLYYLILAPHFHMYLSHLLLVLIYIVNCLTCLFVFLLRWVSR